MERSSDHVSHKDAAVFGLAVFLIGSLIGVLA
jgi:hypothetical protein